jgi:hypothetical protein
MGFARRSLATLIVFVLLTGLPVDAHPMERDRKWDELAVTITNQTISLVLPDKTKLRGIAREVRSDVLVLDVRRSSNTRLHAKGRTEIPRASVSTIDMYLRRQPGGGRGAAIGAGVGAAAMSPLAFYIGESNSAPDWVAGVAIVAGIVVGAIIGHRFDRDQDDPSHVRITVVPQTP